MLNKSWSILSLTLCLFGATTMGQLLPNELPKSKSALQNNLPKSRDISQSESLDNESMLPINNNEESNEGNQNSEEVEKEYITITSVGDIMGHDIQINAAKTVDGYDYDYMFEPIKEHIQSSDFAIGNLELTLAGEKRGYSGYPCFSSPDELAQTLKDVGFDLLTTSNNHSLDKGFEGLKRTIDVLDENNIYHTGTYKTQEESKELLIKEIKGTSFAFLAYTYGTNGIKPPKDKTFCINYLNKELMTKQIKEAREKGAQVIVVSIHYGTEYITHPNKVQMDWVDFLVEQGVDIILGSHPHVLQPTGIRTHTFEGKEKETLILYSMGNFISAQRDRYKDTGAIFDIILSRDKNTNDIHFEKIEITPTWVDLSQPNGKYHFRVLPLSEAFEPDVLVSSSDKSKMLRAQQDASRILMLYPHGKISVKNISKLLQTMAKSNLKIMYAANDY